MKLLAPKELDEPTRPVIEARLSEREFREMFPVAVVELDPLAEAEPSLGCAVRLVSGQRLVATFGRVTEALSIEAPLTDPPGRAVRNTLAELPLTTHVTWTADPEPDELPELASIFSAQSATPRHAIGRAGPWLNLPGWRRIPSTGREFTHAHDLDEGGTRDYPEASFADSFKGMSLSRTPPPSALFLYAFTARGVRAIEGEEPNRSILALAAEHSVCVRTDEGFYQTTILSMRQFKQRLRRSNIRFFSIAPGVVANPEEISSLVVDARTPLASFSNADGPGALLRVGQRRVGSLVRELMLFRTPRG